MINTSPTEVILPLVMTVAPISVKSSVATYVATNKVWLGFKTQAHLAFR